MQDFITVSSKMRLLQCLPPQYYLLAWIRECMKYAVTEPSLIQYIYKTPPHLRLREHWGRGERKSVRSWASGSLLGDCQVISEATLHNMSPQNDCPNLNWTRMIPTNLLKPGLGKDLRPQFYTRTTGNWGKLEVGEVILLHRKKHINWLSSIRWLVTLQGLKRSYLGIHMSIQIHICV